MTNDETEILIARLALDLNITEQQARDMSRRAGLPVPLKEGEQDVDPPRPSPQNPRRWRRL